MYINKTVLTQTSAVLLPLEFIQSWWFAEVGNGVCCINKVNQYQAQLVLRWVTVGR